MSCKHTVLIASNTPNYRVHTRVHVRVSDNYGEFIFANLFSAQLSSRDHLPIISGRRNEVIGPVLVLNTTHFSFCLRRRQIVDVEMHMVLWHSDDISHHLHDSYITVLSPPSRQTPSAVATTY